MTSCKAKISIKPVFVNIKDLNHIRTIETSYMLRAQNVQISLQLAKFKILLFNIYT